MRPTYRRAVLGRVFTATVCALAWVGSPVAAQDVEQIVAYDVTVEVAADASMTVTERIEVVALGREIRRGIYRDFPTSFPKAAGLGRIEAPFAVRSVTRDGNPEPYDLSSIGTTLGRGGIRVRIGDPNVFLEPGSHTYEVVYETARWVHFGDGEDELYWNVTGNGWDFPIGSASATVLVEGLTTEPLLAAWTGPEGSTEQNATWSWSAEGGARFSTTGALEPREGLTISVRFPAGTLTPPSEEQAAEWFRLDWGGYIDASYIVLLVVAVYLLMWYRIGRDPERGHIVVRYEPPEGFSPAALGYLRGRGWDRSLFTATLVSLAVRGALRIEQSGKAWTLHRADDTDELAPDEQAAYVELMHDNERLDVEVANHVTFRAAVKAIKRSLKGRLEREYFVNNRGWFALGVLVSVLGFSALAWRWRFGIEPVAWFLGFWLTGWSAGTGTMLWRVVSDFRAARRGAGAGHYAASILMGCFSVPFVGAWVVVTYLFVGMVPTHVLLAAIAIGFTNVLFYHLLEAPTLRGRGVLNHLEGFEEFLSATDGDRMRRMMEEDPTPELFERYLPHAIALGVEREWATRFEWVLDPSGVMGSPHTFAWYSGDGSAMDATTISTSLGSAFSTHLSSSSAAPSSGGSGGGGGGSSGGGGGGGGGGGW